MAKKKPARTGKRKQPPLPGMEAAFITAIDDAAARYYEVMIERCRLSKDEDEAKVNLIEVMIQNKTARYKTSDGLVIDLTDKKGIKVKRAKEVESNGEA